MFKTDGRQTSADYFWHVFLNAKRFLKFLSKVNDVNTLDTGFMLLCFVELSIDFVPLICLNKSDDDDDQTLTVFLHVAYTSLSLICTVHGVQ